MFAESSGAIQKLRLGTPVVPKEADLHGAAQAIIRLQDVYELDMAEVAAGKIGATESGARLSAKDCLFIGKHCFNGGVLSRSIEWFEEAWMLAGEERNASVSQEQVRGSTVLYCTVLCFNCTVLYYTVLYCRCVASWTTPPSSTTTACWRAKGGLLV